MNLYIRCGKLRQIPVIIGELGTPKLEKQIRGKSDISIQKNALLGTATTLSKDLQSPRALVDLRLRMVLNIYRQVRGEKEIIC